jgi:hypothetical protein
MRLSKDKDMGVIRDTFSAVEQKATPYTQLKDYSLSHRVTMQWDLNEDATRDRIFKLTVGDNVVLLYCEEMMKAGRFI